MGVVRDLRECEIVPVVLIAPFATVIFQPTLLRFASIVTLNLSHHILSEVEVGVFAHLKRAISTQSRTL